MSPKGRGRLSFHDWAPVRPRLGRVPAAGQKRVKGEGLLQRGILGSPHFPLLGPAPTRGLGSGGGGGGGGGPWSPPASAGGRREVAARHGRPGGLHCPIMGGVARATAPCRWLGGSGSGIAPWSAPWSAPSRGGGGTGAGALAGAPLTAPLAVWPAAPLSLALPLALPLALALPSTLPFPPNDPVGVRPRWEEGAGGRSRG